MHARLLLCLALLFSVLRVQAQNDSPYARFGYEGKVLRTPQERQQRLMLLVPNPDTTATVAKVGLDPAKQRYYLFDKQNQVLKTDTLTATAVARFLSVDPLATQYPWYTPYQFAGNTPIQAIDLDGPEEYHYSRIRDLSGRTIGLKLLKVQDIYELNIAKSLTSLKFIYDKNPYKQFAVHQKDTKYLDTVYGLAQETTYDESTTYNSYTEARNSTDSDFGSTGADLAFRALQGLNNVAEEVRENGGPIARSTSSNIGRKSVGAARKGFKPETFEYLQPEGGYLKGKKHGLSWNEASATAKSTGIPQGKWGSISDLKYASEMANTLESGTGGYFPLPAGSHSTVTMPDGTVTPATNIWVRNNGTGTFHGYPTLDNAPKTSGR